MHVRHAIGTRSPGCPNTGTQFELSVIGYPRDWQVNYAGLSFDSPVALFLHTLSKHVTLWLNSINNRQVHQ